MRILIIAVAALALATGSTAGLAKESQGADGLLKALKSMNSGSAPPGQSKRPVDPDQGDDNAALRAIAEVCTKDTPAAERSAICPGEPISPD